MGIYLTLGTIYAFFAILELDDRFTSLSYKLYSFLMIFPMFFLTAFRSINVGTDTIQYNRIFYLVTNFKEYASKSYIEPGYIFLNYLGNKIGISYNVFQVLVTSFIFTSILLFFRYYSVNIAFSCFLFLMLRMMFSVMNISRSWIATAIVLYSIKYVKRAQLKKFVISIVSATILFHTSAIFALILYPLCHMKLTTKRKSQIILLSISIAVIGFPIFKLIVNMLGKYSNFLINVNNETGTAVWISLILHTFFLFLAKKANLCSSMDNKGEISIEHIMYVSGFFLVCLDIIGLRINVFNRVTIHYLPFLTVLVPISIQRIKSARLAFLMKMLILQILAVYFIIILKFRPEWNQVIPYSTFWVK